MPQDNLTAIRIEQRTGSASVGPDALPKAPPTDQGHAEQCLPCSSSPPLAVTDACLQESTCNSGIKLEFHTELAAIEQEWKAFERRADCTAFQTFDWLAAWQRHIGARKGAVPAIVLGRDEHGQLLFIFQFAIESRGLGRRLTWLGSDLCDYNAPLLATRFADDINSDRFISLWQEIIAALRAHPRFRFDWIDLQKMPEAIGVQRNPFLNLQVLAHPSGAYVTNLGADWNKFYAAKRSSSTRKKERPSSSNWPNTAKCNSSTCRTAPMSSGRSTRCSIRKRVLSPAWVSKTFSRGRAIAPSSAISSPLRRWRR
jgi:hypothetical protein